jgi:GH15 family glucan-1,4-alpha-glucosidase
VPVIYRVVACEGGDAEVDIEFSPRFDYARAETRIVQNGDGRVTAECAEAHLVLAGLREEARIHDGGAGAVLRARVRLAAGERRPLLLAWGEQDVERLLHDWEPELDRTTRAWQEWLASQDRDQPCDFGGEWQPLIDRSGLALKLLTYPRTGAIAAAATTSLPEDIGGVRNWDYRFTWIRDASFTAQAFVALGHRREAVQFLNWAETVSMKDSRKRERLHLMYSLYGETDLEEQELPHLEGYRRSTPVRVGNKASEQFQLDIYGELLDAAWELARLGQPVSAEQWEFLTFVADEACRMWQEPDYGIWEVRSEKQHFVHSKLMAWVALDRALRLSRRLGLKGDTDRWRRTREAVRAWVLEKGYDEDRGAFVQAYGSRSLDAANLAIVLEGFLPAEDERVQSTIDRSLEELTENGLVFRYRTEDEVDGLPGHEGAFGLTTFWMVDALALSGRLDEANAMFEGIARRANHVGLFSEELDPATGLFLGNFPQAFTHIGFINSALYIAHAEGRPTPAPAPMGSKDQREEDRTNGE